MTKRRRLPCWLRRGRSGEGSGVFPKFRLLRYVARDVEAERRDADRDVPFGVFGDGSVDSTSGGSFCFSVSTGLNRSPSSPARRMACSGSKYKESRFFFFSAVSSSSQVTGIDT